MYKTKIISFLQKTKTCQRKNLRVSQLAVSGESGKGSGGSD